MVNFLLIKLRTVFYVFTVTALSSFGLFAIITGITLHLEGQFAEAFALYLAGFTAIIFDIWCSYRVTQLVEIWSSKGVLMNIQSSMKNRKN
ncbi:MAG: hypothetical protein ABIH20_01275 [Candidatus Diapherotrites archaeon]